MQFGLGSGGHLKGYLIAVTRFLAFREYVTDYVESKEFLTLLSETKAMKADLATVKYCMLIENGTIKVRKYQGETDYSVEIENTLKSSSRDQLKITDKNFVRNRTLIMWR